MKWSYLKALLPSPLSLAISFAIALSFVVGHVLVLSTASGLLLPNLLHGSAELWGTVLISWVEPVVTILTENIIVATLTIALLWMGVGIAAYSAISSTIAAANEARNLSDPTMRLYLQLLAWHVAVGLVTIGLTMLFVPFIKWLLARDELLILSQTVPELLGMFGITILGWLAIFHAYLVVYRLYRYFYLS